MAFQKGQSGNPGGRPTERPIRDALAIVAKEPISKKDKTKKARKLAEVLFDAALAGDIQAAREITDRLEGKATQVVAGDNEGGAIKHTVEVVLVEPDA